MKADLELTITHDGEAWIARNDTISVAGRTLPELDGNLKEALRIDGRFAGSKVTVFMGFDFSLFPVWLRQFHTHYFNRFVTVDM